ncbi:MAG: hypothetical protein C0410_10720 [Anaerolinea sp.]|nr:hypothetical protein [Anaerolinea sp.]
MKNKLALAVPIIVAVIVMTAGMGVITKVYANNNPQVNSSPTVEATAYAQPKQSYQQISTLADGIQEQTTPDPLLDSTATYLLTAEQASSIAQIIAGVAPKDLPELVSFRGTPAYEVEFMDREIYVDANSGVILFTDLQKPDTENSTEEALSQETNHLKTSQSVEMETSTNHDSEVYDVRSEDDQSVYEDLNVEEVATPMASPTHPSNSSSSSVHESESSNNNDDQD